MKNVLKLEAGKVSFAVEKHAYAKHPFWLIKNESGIRTKCSSYNTFEDAASDALRGFNRYIYLIART